MLARFLEVGSNHVLGVGFAFHVGQAHLPRRPFAEQPVAAGDDSELHLLVASELVLERFLAVVEGGHAFPLSIRRAR